MADIALRGLYDQKSREFGTQGGGLIRFDSDFIDAVNRAINRINRDADLATRITRIDDVADTVDGLDEAYEDVLSDGVSLVLMQMGRRPAKGAEPLINSFEAKFAGGIMGIYTDLKNAENDAWDSTTDADYDSGTIGLWRD